MNSIYAHHGNLDSLYSIDIYTGCPHGCWYCSVPIRLNIEQEQFHSNCEPRANIVEQITTQLEQMGISDQNIFLCPNCDPYPSGVDSSATRDVIRVIKESGNHVQILTKGIALRDFDLLDERDWFGLTFDGGFRIGGFVPFLHMHQLRKAHDLGIKTWVSFTPVLNEESVLGAVEAYVEVIDNVVFGRLENDPPNTKWERFLSLAKELCQSLQIEYQFLLDHNINPGTIHKHKEEKL